jgi:hypothetical protein
MWGFVTTNFYSVGSSAPRPTPNLEDQGISLSLASPSKPVRHGWPYQQLLCRRHSFRVHWCTQAPSPSNKVLSTGWRYHQGGHLFIIFLFYIFLPCLIVLRIITQTFFTYKVQAYYQDSATQKGGNQHTCLEKDSNSTTPVSKQPKPAPKTAQPLKPTPLLSDVR